MKIVIDGLIGAGKSTQADIVSQRLGLDVVKEPITEWPLDLFYSDPTRWGFLMQVSVLCSFDRLKNKSGVFERSPCSSFWVFWRNLVNTGIVTAIEDDIYQRMYKILKWSPDITIFIDKTPDNCHKHIQTRGQAGDKSIDIAYLRQHHDLYKTYMANAPKGKSFIVDGNGTVEETTQKIMDILIPLMGKDECQPLKSECDVHM